MLGEKKTILNKKEDFLNDKTPDHNNLNFF
jgi:hypothetical protein